MTTEQQQRKVFEEWADSMGYSTFQYKDPDEYVSDDTYTTWVAWQAASKELATVTEQRDALAEALEQLMSYQPRATVITTNERHVWSNAKDALQSLNQPTEP